MREAHTCGMKIFTIIVYNLKSLESHGIDSKCVLNFSFLFIKGVTSPEPLIQFLF